MRRERRRPLRNWRNAGGFGRVMKKEGNAKGFGWRKERRITKRNNEEE